MSNEKRRYPRELALSVAKELCDLLKPVTDRLLVAGSLRRRKETVGDVEILYVSRIATMPVPGDLFAQETYASADVVISSLVGRGVLAKRESATGTTAYGAKNKLCVHVGTGIPVDLFAATKENWFNYVVCRTGPADSNTLIATLAKQRGWKWNPYGAGFTNLETNEVVEMTSEEAVFAFLGLPYRQPWERV